MITKFEKENVRMMRKEVDNALSAISEKYGLEFKLGNLTYSSNEFHGKLSCITKQTESGKEFDKTKDDFEYYCYRFGLEPSDYGKIFDFKNKKFKVVGLKPRSYAYPLIVEELGTYKRYQIPANNFLASTKGLNVTVIEAGKPDEVQHITF